MATPVDPGIISIEPENAPRESERRVGFEQSIRMQQVTRDEPSTASSTDVTFRTNRRQMNSESKRAKKLLFMIKVVFGIFFYAVVLVSTVFSKLTLVSLTEKLRTFPINSKPKNLSVALYWQLLLVIMIPTFITFVRSLVSGVLGKTTETFPWPTMRSAITGIVASVFEVIAICVFVFLVLAGFPPGISIFLLSGVVFCQIAVDFFYTKKNCCGIDCSKLNSSDRNGYENLQKGAAQSPSMGKTQKIFGFLNMVFENRIIKLLALFLQLASIITFIVLWACFYTGPYHELPMFSNKLRPLIALPLCLIVLSVIWTNKFQDYIAKIYTHQIHDDRTARYKSSFINSSVRLVLYPFIAYIVFRYATGHQIDPWCIDFHPQAQESCLDFKGETLTEFLVQISTTLFAYVIGLVACTMTLNPYGMALPLLAATPLSAICYYIHAFGYLQHVDFFPSFENPEKLFSAVVYPYAPLIVLILWIGQVLGIGLYAITRRNIILADDSDMFLIPYYDGIFFEQQMLLNRQTKKWGVEQTGHQVNYSVGERIVRNPRMIFICSTMYRENVVEMRQMLTSIKRVATHYERERKVKGDNCDQYESHIFFDGALNGTQLQQFGLQLLSLLKDTLGVKPNSCVKKVTPYGMCLQYKLNEVENMPFHIHFKDRNLVKPKKRWSQVMYMNYVIKHRIETNPNLTADNTFILTTDADIDFTAKSAVVLLDMLETNPLVGAVCARTHPKGSGPLYWYQVFDYAVGHWFQKPAEHLMGCVLCSPGCFSVFRCSALQEVLETYSTLATNGVEFLMKDMGEDRWLCTLLIKKGWRLEYCAISEDLTYCPLDFGEFYGQRRRWIPSTIANLSLLISETSAITRKNDTVSILFILFQAIMVFSTAISPATVILVIASGLQSSFNFSDEIVLLIISLLIIVSVFYGAVCLFASPKTQIDMAKVLSFIFAIIMIVVIAGIFTDVIKGIFPYPKLTFLVPPNCTKTGPNITPTYEDCSKDAKFLASLPNTLPKDPPFKLPVSSSVIYLGVFALTFLVAAVLHLPEFTCLFHSIWYLLALPSGYLLLLIYSAANLDSQSWGTREGSSGADEGLLGWWRYIKNAWTLMISCCMRSRCCKQDKDSTGQKAAEEKKKKEEPSEDDDPAEACPTVDVVYERMHRTARDWLLEQGCSDEYIQKFEENGYTTKHYIAAMTHKDFEAIGINKRGFRLRLAKAAKRLPSLPIHVDIPKDVAKWLENLEMSEYEGLFRAEGYETSEDIENLKGLTEKELRGIGIIKRAHLQRLSKALHSLAYPKEVEQRMYQTKGEIENVDNVKLDPKEKEFWKNLIDNKLKPLSTQLTSIEEIKQSLRSLRNTMLVILFLVNIMWITALYSVEFPRLADYGFDPRAFQLLFLAVYGFIIIVQFVMMLLHRGITLVHYFGRITPVQVVAPDSKELDFEVVSIVANRPQNEQ